MNQVDDKILASMNKAIAETAVFFDGLLNKKGNVDELQFDSIVQSPVVEMPSVLKNIFDSGVEIEYRGNIEAGVLSGVQEYAIRNGGERPSASVIASALIAGAEVAKYYKKEFDSATDLSKTILKTDELLFDSAVPMNNIDQASIVPALTQVTIANIIANASPMYSLIPNPTNSIRVPLAYVHFEAEEDHLATKKGDRVDGINSAKPYFEGAFLSLMKKDTGNRYKAFSRKIYTDAKTFEMDESSDKIYFFSGNVGILLNGLEIAHSRGKHENNSKSGKVILSVKEKYHDGIAINDEMYKVIKAEADLGECTVTIEFDKALPDNTSLLANLRIDYEAKREGDKKQYKHNGVGVQSVVHYESIQAVPDRMEHTFSVYSIEQHHNELGLPLMATVLSMMQSKYFLEQRCRLYKLAKLIARFNQKKSFVIDISRGAIGNVASATNTTGELMAEMFKTLDLARDDISIQSGGSAVRYSILVSDNMKHLLACLPSERYTQYAMPARYNAITRIGTLSNGIEVYYSPQAQEILTEGHDTAEVLMIGETSEAVKNPFVGLITKPPVMSEVRIDSRDVTGSIDMTLNADVNPNDYYARQVRMIDFLNLPVMTA